MKIETVEIGNIEADFWLVNKGLESEFIAPINYGDELEFGSLDDEKIINYKALLAWFGSGNKGKKYSLTRDELFSKSKHEKMKSITKARQAYENRPVEFKNNDVTQYLAGGQMALDKYNKAYDLAVRMGLTHGKIPVILDLQNPSLIPVDIDMETAKEALNRLGVQTYNAELKEGYYLHAINQATTAEALEAIKWEDTYTGGEA